MDQRGIDGRGLEVLSMLGDAVINNGGRGVPGTVSFTPTWQSQAHYAQNPGFPDQVSGPIFITPSEIKTRIGLVSVKFSSLDADIRQNISRPDFLSSWASFKKAWDEFAQKHDSDIRILTTGTGTVNRQIDAFEVDLRGWQDAMVREAPQGHFQTAPVTSSQSAVQQPLPPGGTKPAFGGLPWWAISVGTVAGLGLLAYAGYKLYSKLSPTSMLLRAASHDANYTDSDYGSAAPQHVHYYGGY